MPFIRNAEGKMVMVDDESVELNERLQQRQIEKGQDPLIIDAAQVDDIRKAVNASPGFDNENQLKSELLDLKHPDVQKQLDILVNYSKRRQKVLDEAKSFEADNPILGEEARKVAENAAKPKRTFLDKVSRIANFYTARDAGATRGFIRSLEGEGSPMQEIMSILIPGYAFAAGLGTDDPNIKAGIKEGIEKNLGFGEVLEEDLNVPSVKFPLPFGVQVRPNTNIKFTTPADIFWGLGKTVLDGNKPVEFKILGPVITTNQVLGLSLDILRDPITYISFGSASVPKGVIKGFAKNPRLALKFAGLDVITDKNLMDTIKLMKIDKAGQEVIKVLDNFMATTNFGRGVTKVVNATKEIAEDVLSNLFVPLGRNLDVFKGSLKVQERIIRRAKDLQQSIQGIFSPFDNATKKFMFLKGFNRMKAEARVREPIMVAFANKKISEKAFDAAMARIPKINIRDTVINGKLVKGSEMTKAMQEMVDVTNALAKQAGLPDSMTFTTYMPSIFEDSFKSAGMSSKALAGLRKGTPGFFKKKTFKIDETLVTNIESAFSKRTSQLIALGETRTYMKGVIKKFGRKFKTPREALEAGYVNALQKSSSLRFFKQKFVQEIGEETVEKSVLAVGKGSPTFLPNKVMRSLEDVDKLGFKPSKGSGKRFLIDIIDAFTQPFKIMVTSIWPAFTMRNIRNNILNGITAEGFKFFSKGKFPEAAALLGNINPNGVTKLAGKEFKNIALIRLAQKERIISGGQFSDSAVFWGDFERVLKGGGDVNEFANNRILGALDQLRPSKNNLLKAARKVNQLVEEEFRMASFLRAMDDGLKPADAAQLAFQGLFDYSLRTPFEKNVLGRIFPFWTWPTRNLGLQISKAITNPGRQAGFFKAINEIQREQLRQLSDEQLQAWNEMENAGYLGQMFALPIGADPNDPDQVLFMSGLGFGQDEATAIFDPQNIGFSLNPGAKFLAGEAARVGLLGKNISFKTNYRFDEFKFIAKNLLGKKNLTDQELFDWVNDVDGFQANPFVRFLGIKATKQTKFEKGKALDKKKDFRLEFQANPTMINILNSSLTARMMSSMRQDSREGSTETEDFARVFYGLSYVRASLTNSAKFQLGSQIKGVQQEVKKVGKGFSFDITTSKETGTKRFFKKLAQIKKRN